MLKGKKRMVYINLDIYVCITITETKEKLFKFLNLYLILLSFLGQ